MRIKTALVSLSIVSFLFSVFILDSNSLQRIEAAQMREIRIVSTSATIGGSTSILVELVSLGNENSASFSIEYDPAIFVSPMVKAGTGAPDATLQVDTSQANTGKLGISLSRDTGNTFTIGTRQLIVITANIAGTAAAGATTILFGDTPTARSVKDADGASLATVYSTGTINLVPPNVPILSSLNPSSILAGNEGKGDFTLLALGSNFVRGAVVKWNGADRTTTFVNSTRLTAAIPASDIVNPGTAVVTVVNPGGGAVSNPLNFTIQPVVSALVPTIASISPALVLAESPDVAITINGTNFLDRSKARIDGNELATTFVSESQLMATIPAARLVFEGTAMITVVNSPPGGGTSNAVPFLIVDGGPAITGGNPASAVAGGAGFTLTVNGIGFVSGSTVRWNGSERTTTFVSGTQLTAAIPATDIAARGTADITVVNPGTNGGTSNKVQFAINAAAPTITTLNPASVTAGGANFTLTVNGTGFVNASTVQWNGSNRPTTFVSATQLTAAIPAADIATSGSSNISVLNPVVDGGSSNTASFAINTAAPTISTLNPASANAGGANFTLTVNGTGFVNASKVQWNGSDRTTTFVSATQLTVAIPAADIAAPGTASVTVLNPAASGGASNAVQLTINSSAPAITTLNPTSANAGGANFTLTVNGTGFVNASTVQWNGGNRATTFVSATQLTAAIPAADIAAAGTASITVVNPSPGGGTSNTFPFSIVQPNPAPALTGLNPRFVVAGSSAITLNITGSNFTNGSIIRWNDTDRPTTFVSATQLQAAIPATDLAAAATANIKVFTPAPGGGTSNAVSFVIANGPFTSVSAASFQAPSNQRADLAIDSIVAGFGTGLATSTMSASSLPLPTNLAGTKVTVRDRVGTERLAPEFFVSPGQINFQLPSDAADGEAIVTVTSSDNKTTVGLVNVVPIAPGLFTANADGAGVPAAALLRVKANGAQVFESISQFDSATRKFVPAPIDLGPESDQVFLVLFGTGFRNRSALTGVVAQIGGQTGQITYAGLQPGSIGLDQCNIRIPRSLIGRGVVNLVMTVDGKPANTVTLSIK